VYEPDPGRSLVPEPESDGVVLRAVSAGYGDAIVLRDVSIAVAAGSITGLIGPNGSGKTTLVRVASRGLRPRRGSVRVCGIDPYAASARQVAKLVAVVPQDVAPAFSYSVLEMVMMGRSPYLTAWGGGRAEDWAQVRRAMAAANVQHLAERSLADLSGGERQRVVLAQALSQDAPVLLLDEPTTHLDLRHVVEMLGLVRGLARDQGKAVLAIFHDLNLAAAYCDHVVALEDGAVVRSGPPEAVITRDLVRDVFGVEADVSPSGSAGRPSVVVAPPVAAERRPGARRAHVIGGAGRGAPVMRLLAERGFDVSVGVLHGSDTDEVVAERLNLQRVTVPPFSGIDARSAEDCRAFIQEAAIVVVCDPPFGPGNVRNLELVLEAARAGTPTVMLDQVPIEERDFTGGEATSLWRALREVARIARTVDDLTLLLPAESQLRG
jgi:cobalamin transport system ATP-binding protein